MLNELKRYLNIENNEKDFLLENWILEAKEFIKSIIWEFEKKTFEKNIATAPITIVIIELILKP